MRFRQWLLTGGSLAALSLLPGLALAQEAEFRALQEAQNSGDADAAAAAEQALNDACAAAGYGSLDECISAIQGGGQPQEEAAPVEDQQQEEAPPPEDQQVEEPAPAEEPQAEEPAPQEEPQQVEEPQQTEEPAPAEEPQAEQAPAEEPPAEEAAPAEDQQQQADAPQQTEEAQPADQPQTEEAPAEDQQAVDQPATDEQQPAEEPQAEDQPAQVDPAAAELDKAFQLYQVGIGQLDSGDSAGQSTIDAANQQFAEICAGLGIADVAQCLAQYGIELPPIPQVAEKPANPDEKPIADLPGADEAVAPDTAEVLPESVKPEEAAPILDSSKDIQTDEANGVTPDAVADAPEEPAAPPPEDDKAAQADIGPVEVQSLADMQGEKLDKDALPQFEVPQNVTIINNVTNVTNTTIINNNGGGEQKPNKPGKGDDKPNYTNSGFIFNIGVNLVISNPAADFDRISDDDEDFVYYERLSNGRVKETIERPNGVKIVTIRNRWGEVLKRSRILPNGREYILAYYDEDDEDDDFFNWRDPGDDLPPLRLTIPVRDYILDADQADEDEVELFFRKPPVETVKKIYTIDDVKRSARLRDSVRRIEVGGLTFDSGKATISRSQIGALSKVANAMLKMLDDNPAETFLIEGHTDAVGSDQANLVLSDARAATVAKILTDFYGVPPENLVTQGYGERYLKVKTEEAERLNRRVSIKRITPLITVSSK